MANEAHLEARMNRRMAAEARFIDRMERREREAEQMVGTLIREGREIFYINIRNLAGTLTGRTREFASEQQAIGFLIRNRYA